MIIETVGESDFVRAFERMGRKDQFTYNGLTALYQYLEEVYSGDTWELDVIGLCCDYAEYEEDELMKEYNSDNEYETIEELLDYLRDNTTVIDTGVGSYIIQAF